MLRLMTHALVSVASLLPIATQINPTDQRPSPSESVCCHDWCQTPRPCRCPCHTPRPNPLLYPWPRPHGPCFPIGPLPIR